MNLKKEVVRISSTRVRAYTCTVCDSQTEILGETLPKTVCGNCGADMEITDTTKPDYDLLVSSQRHTKPYPGSIA